MASQTTGYITSVKVNDGAIQNIGSSAYGVCEIAAGTAAKTVEMTGFKLVNGATIHVRFTNSNTVANPTLNVNSTGAKKIFRYGITTPSTSAASSWNAGAVISFTYDSSLDSSNGAWIMNDWVNNNDNTDRSGIAYCSTAAGTAAKVGTMPNFSLATNQVIILKLDTTSTVASATLNVNSTGAKTIRIGGAATTTSNFVAGYWWAQYDGTYWNLTRIYFTDTNDKVNQSSTTTANWRKIVLGYQNDASAGTAVTAQTNVVYVDPDFEYQPSTGVVRIKSSDPDIIKLYRSTASSGAFISYFNNNQTTNYWRAGMGSDGTMTFQYNGTNKVSFNSSGNVAATSFNNYTLAAACAKGVDTSITAGSTSTNLPTSAAVENRLLFTKGTGNDSIVSKIIDTSNTQNTATAQFGLSIGGYDNANAGIESVILDGHSNTISSVSTGTSGSNATDKSFIATSVSSTIKGPYGVIIGSDSSQITPDYFYESNESAGHNTIINSASSKIEHGIYSTIIGGNSSEINSKSSNCTSNIIIGTNSVIDSGTNTNATLSFNTIIGGSDFSNKNRIGFSGLAASYPTISYNSIIGGQGNSIYYGQRNSVIGGQFNYIGYNDSTLQYLPSCNDNSIMSSYSSKVYGQVAESGIYSSYNVEISSANNSKNKLAILASYTSNMSYDGGLYDSAIIASNSASIDKGYETATLGTYNSHIYYASQSADIAGSGNSIGDSNYSSSTYQSACLASNSSNVSGSFAVSIGSSSAHVNNAYESGVYSSYGSTIEGGSFNAIIGDSSSGIIYNGTSNAILGGNGVIGNSNNSSSFSSIISSIGSIEIGTSSSSCSYSSILASNGSISINGATCAFIGGSCGGVGISNSSYSFIGSSYGGSTVNNGAYNTMLSTINGSSIYGAENVMLNCTNSSAIGSSSSTVYMDTMIHGNNNTITGNNIVSIGGTGFRLNNSCNNQVHTGTLVDHTFTADDGADALIIPWSVSIDVSTLGAKAHIYVPEGYVAVECFGDYNGGACVSSIPNGYTWSGGYQGSWSGNFVISVKTWEFHYHKAVSGASVPWNTSQWMKRRAMSTVGGIYGMNYTTFSFPSGQQYNAAYGIVGDVEFEVTSAVTKDDNIGDKYALIYGTLYCVKNTKIPSASEMTTFS